MFNGSRIVAGILVGLSVAMLSCDSGTEPEEPGEPASLQIVSGDEQDGVVGQQLDDPLVVRVVDEDGQPIQGQLVNFVVVSGGGSVFAGSGLSNTQGIVQERWTLGTSTAVEQRVEARAVDSDTGEPIVFATFTATALPGPAASVEKSAGDGREGTVSQQVTTRPAVRVVDQYGNPVAGVQVTFAVASGSGSVTGASATSDAQGIATVGGWTLGPAAGPQTLTASAPGLAAVTFTVTARAGAAFRLTFASAPPTTSTNGGILPSIAVQLEDAHGNAVAQAGVTVTASVASGGGTLTGTLSVATDAQGRATFDNLRLAGEPGQHTLRFSGSGLTSATTPSIVLTAGAPAIITIIAGDDQQIPAGTAAPISPSVRVTDAGGTPIAGAQVIFALQSGVASPASAFRTTNANGIATLETWTVGTQVGTVSMTASMTGVPGVVFTATIVPGAPASVTKHAGDGQLAPLGAAVTVPPAARVADAHGNPVSGAPVTFSVTSGGGTITGAQATTNAQGIATIGSWTLGNSPGQQTLQASAGSAGVVTFTATAITGVATRLAFLDAPPDNVQVGFTLPSIVIGIQDAAGNLVRTQGVPVTASIAGGTELGGTTVVHTNSAGQATFVNLTVYGTATQGVLAFNAPGLTGVQKAITISPAPNAPASMTKHEGDIQSATTGTAVPIAPAVRVTDQNGTPLARVTVTFQVTNGGGSVTGATPFTNAQGIARVDRWTLGAVGPQALTASAAGVPSVTFTATAVGAGRVLTKVSGDDQVGDPLVPLSQPLRVRLTDDAGNPVAGAELEWKPVGGGNVTGNLQCNGPLGLPSTRPCDERGWGLTDADGYAQASWRPGTGGEVQYVEVRARVTPAPEPAVFTASIRPGMFGSFVSAGSDQTCALRDNVAYCWGPSPYRVPGVPQFASISTANFRTCALTPDGQLWCWGTGVNEGPQPQQPERRFLSYELWGANSCGLTTDGEVLCTGTARNEPTDLRFRAVSLGYNHACGIAMDQRVYCWGQFATAAMGGRDPSNLTTPMPIASTSTYKSISAGGNHTCAITTDDVLHCWGDNGKRQLGRPVSTTPTPGAVVGFEGVVTSVEAGSFHTCAITSSGAAYCWGDDSSGQVGDGGTISGSGTTSEPRRVANNLDYSSISAGNAHTCAVRSTGAIHCWGYAPPTGTRQSTNLSSPNLVLSPQSP